ncbi:MAG: DUF58 domain-containing protein [Bacteroidota bacterium]
MASQGKATFQQLLTPEVLSTASGLEFISKVVVDGYLSGHHRSNRLGTGMEFSQYRNYQPGDDLRLLDWKMLARSGKYFVKESEVETNISVRFIIDLSASMLYEEAAISKLSYAKVIASSLAFLSQKQGDAISLFGLNSDQVTMLSPRMDKQHFHRFLSMLVNMKAEGFWPTERTKTEALHDRRYKEMIIFITDLYESNQELMDFISRLKTIRNEVMVLNVTGQKELELDFDGVVTFQDLETSARIKVDSSKARGSYIEAFNNRMSEVKSQLASRDIYYEMIRLNESPAHSLELFLKRRMKLI